MYDWIIGAFMFFVYFAVDDFIYAGEASSKAWRQTQMQQQQQPQSPGDPCPYNSMDEVFKAHFKSYQLCTEQPWYGVDLEPMIYTLVNLVNSHIDSFQRDVDACIRLTGEYNRRLDECNDRMNEQMKNIADCKEFLYPVYSNATCPARL